MGMAASQARFLGLTARKSNTEYQGQQVNQQRTTLSNKSAALYNQMMALEVPTPPSPESYYNKTYSFVNQTSNGNVTYKFADYSTLQHSAEVSYTEKAMIMKKSNSLNIKYDNSKSKYFVGDKEATVSKCTDSDATSAANETGVTNDDWKDTTTYQIETKDDNGKKVYYYINQKDYAALTAKENGKNLETPVSVWKKDEGEVNRTATLKDITFEFNKSGRITSIKTSSNVTGTGLSGNATYNVSFEKEKDDEAYEQAMLDYKYKQAQYDNEYDRINAETEKIQGQDKQLELKLKNLDTEQQAIQTELEAVTKVIDKNVEDTFKTFA